MKAPKLDLVVVGFTGELRALKLQARSIRLYAKPGMFGRIFYICNDQAYGVFKRFITREVIPELGDFSSQGEVVDYQKLVGKRIKKTGWRSQQTLKLLAAHIVTAPQFLILDSKNHFIRPFDTSVFMSADDKLRVNSVPINTLFRQHFNAACDYFNVQGGKKIEQAHPTTTPFMMATHIAKDLMDAVEAREGKPFFDVFIGKTEWNEFYLYYVYMLSKNKLLETTYEERTRYVVAFFAGSAESPERLKMLLGVIEQKDICCTGVHRHVFEVAMPENLAAIASMWLRFGLINTQAEAVYFQTFDKPVKRKRFILF